MVLTTEQVSFLYHCYMDKDEESVKETVSLMAKIIAEHIYKNKHEYVAGYSESNQDVRHNKNQHKQDSDYKAD